MILPLRVLGRLVTNSISAGTAMRPSFVADVLLQFGAQRVGCRSIAALRMIT